MHSILRRSFPLPLIAALLLPAAARSETPRYPTKPIRVVTAEPGGGNDIAARVIAQGVSARLGQQIIVDNRGGASGAIAAGIVAGAPADGYTLLLYGNNVWLLPLLTSNARYDAERAFAPITLAISSPTILVVHPSVQAASVRELIALAKSAPGTINYASAASGGAAHLAAELFKAMAGVDIVRVNYKGTPPALNDVIGGRVQIMFAVVAAAAPHVKAGRLRALAVTSAAPTDLAPGLPTVAASGLPGYKLETTIGVLAPARTPPSIINLLNREIVTYLKLDETRDRFFKAGADVVASTPAEFAGVIHSDIATMGKVIKQAGIRAD